MKKYIIYDNYKIGYIKDICACEKCEERGRAEVFINDLNDNYQDCIKANEIENIIYLGDSLSDAISELVRYFEREIEAQRKANQFLQELVDLYSNLKN